MTKTRECLLSSTTIVRHPNKPVEFDKQCFGKDDQPKTSPSDKSAYTFKEEYWFDPKSSVYDPAYQNKSLKDKCEIIAERWQSNKVNWEADQSELWKRSADNNSDDMVAIGCKSVGLNRPHLGSEPTSDYQAYLSAMTEVRKGVTGKILVKLNRKGVSWDNENDPIRLGIVQMIEAEMKPEVFNSAPKTLSRSQLDSIWQEIRNQIQSNL